MQTRDFRKRVAGPNVACPPLAKACHVRIVPSHLDGKPVDFCASGPQSHAQLWLFTRNEIVAITAHVVKCGDAKQRVPAAGKSLAGWRVPFEVAQQIVEACLGMPFVATPADDGQFCICIEGNNRGRQPASIDLAIAVHELNVFDFRRGFQQLLEPGISCPCSSERSRQIEIDNFDVHGAGQIRTAIRRARIDIDDGVSVRIERLQTTSQPLSFVATDRDHTNAGQPTLLGRAVCE